MCIGDNSYNYIDQKYSIMLDNCENIEDGEQCVRPVNLNVGQGKLCLVCANRAIHYNMEYIESDESVNRNSNQPGLLILDEAHMMNDFINKIDRWCHVIKESEVKMIDEY